MRGFVRCWYRCFFHIHHALNSFFARFLRPFIRPFGMKLRRFIWRYMKLAFQKVQHSCAFAGFCGDTWRYRNWPIHFDAKFHGFTHLLCRSCIVHGHRSGPVRRPPRFRRGAPWPAGRSDRFRRVFYHGRARFSTSFVGYSPQSRRGIVSRPGRRAYRRSTDKRSLIDARAQAKS